MKILMLFIPITVIVLPACGQDIPATQVPSVVQNTVLTKFSNARNIEWQKKPGFYKAEFDVNKTGHTVQVASNGQILLYKIDIPETELPTPVSSAIKQYQAGYTIDDTEKVEKDGHTYYLVELEKKGEKDKTLLFRPDGTIMVNTIDTP